LVRKATPTPWLKRNWVSHGSARGPPAMAERDHGRAEVDGARLAAMRPSSSRNRSVFTRREDPALTRFRYPGCSSTGSCSHEVVGGSLEDARREVSVTCRP
jgi:hypothetical protein